MKFYMIGVNIASLIKTKELAEQAGHLQQLELWNAIWH